jgi:hypothetical protein
MPLSCLRLYSVDAIYKQASIAHYRPVYPAINFSLPLASTFFRWVCGILFSEVIPMTEEYLRLFSAITLAVKQLDDLKAELLLAQTQAEELYLKRTD